jgi:hypothetical protein
MMPSHAAPILAGPQAESGFRASFRKEQQALRAGLVQSGLMVHGLRHNAVTVLVEAGVSVEDAAALLRWRSSKVAEQYSCEADRRT